jgi:hypothetical protein
MPSRLAIAGILLAWLAVTGYVVRREVLPRYFADTPPAIDFVLVDELSTAPTQWTVYRDEAKVGSMTSRTEYLAADDSFRFISNYRGLQFGYDLPRLKVTIDVPSATTTIRVDRAGQLREQVMTGQFEASMAGVSVGAAKMEVEGRVSDGHLRGRAKLELPVFLTKPFEEDLEPVPVPNGQVMNPLMPVDRLRGVSPGRRWAIRLIDPVRDSLYLLVTKLLEKQGAGTKLLSGWSMEDKELVAEVESEPVTLDREGGPVSCWVIRYESADKSINAKTFVRRDDGRVVRQEATGFGERWRFERTE